MSHALGGTWGPEVKKTALSLGERVSRDGAFTSRRGTGEGLLRRREHGEAWSGLYRSGSSLERYEVICPSRLLGSNS